MVAWRWVSPSSRSISSNSTQMLGRVRADWRRAALAVVALAAWVAAGCGGPGGSASETTPTTSKATASAAPTCGKGPVTMDAYYAMNLMRDDADVDPRGKALLDAAHAALLGRDGRRAGFA
jgi:hypothetical protein